MGKIINGVNYNINLPRTLLRLVLVPWRFKQLKLNQTLARIREQLMKPLSVNYGH